MPAKGNHQPEEAKERIRAFHKGREKTPEHRANLAASLRGKKRAPRSEETKRKIRDAQLGRKKSPEEIEKNRISHMGIPSARKGLSLSEETKQKVRDARSLQTHPRMVARGITQSEIDKAVASGLRWCAGKCKAFLPIEAFYKKGNTKRTVCCACGLSLNRNVTFRKYGVDADWYETTLAAQGGMCALCPSKANGEIILEPADWRKKGRLAIDHDHDTGRARGLLCTPCNLSLHRVEYVQGWAKRAVEYLRRHGSDVGKQRTPEDLPDGIV